MSVCVCECVCDCVCVSDCACVSVCVCEGEVSECVCVFECPQLSSTSSWLGVGNVLYAAKSTQELIVP